MGIRVQQTPRAALGSWEAWTYFSPDGLALSTPGSQDEGHREQASGPHRALKDLVSLVIEFEAVQPGRVLWAHGLKPVTAGKLLYRRGMEMGWSVVELVTQASHPATHN